MHADIAGAANAASASAGQVEVEGAAERLWAAWAGTVQQTAIATTRFGDATAAAAEAYRITDETAIPTPK